MPKALEVSPNLASSWQDHHWDHVADHGTKTAGRGQGGTLAVGVGHGGKQRTHGDVEHGVAALVKDLAEEQHHKHRVAVEQRGDCPEHDRGDGQQRSGTQQPGAELAVLIVMFCVHFVHKRAHHRVVHGVPDVPDKKQRRQDGGIDLQHVGVIAGDHGAHQRKGHAAAKVAHGVADFVLERQAAFLSGGSHFVIPPVMLRHSSRPARRTAVSWIQHTTILLQLKLQMTHRLLHLS